MKAEQVGELKREKGRPSRTVETTRTHTYVPVTIKDMLVEIAAHNGTNLVQAVCDLIDEAHKEIE
ncbi:hypothetical protein A8L34_28200 [Bacillus sp. FJAT-27264]|uniref:hypothetical protein n=1 Tax=Paenibacillus sp. (strain DSM 101736 / FJAT-27264) TaxID=1850362 RepID=UPI0008081581|nr:hypothetical protein [Bacillus sp. FJAT-27264]OBZ15931.1 hypothetical protein A8L34_28200 [Bacillus sp. FJAT-27264]